MRSSTLALLAVVVAGCTTTRPTPTSPSPNALATSFDVTPRPSDVAATPCTGDIVFTGGYDGEVHGAVEADVRPTGISPAGAVIDTRFVATVEGRATPMIFALWDPDGPTGTKPANGLFGPALPIGAQDAPLSWQENTGVGTATVEADGSQAIFDVVFTGLRPDTHLVGALRCARIR